MNLGSGGRVLEGHGQATAQAEMEEAEERGGREGDKYPSAKTEE